MRSDVNVIITNRQLSCSVFQHLSVAVLRFNVAFRSF